MVGPEIQGGGRKFLEWSVRIVTRERNLGR